MQQLPYFALTNEPEVSWICPAAGAWVGPPHNWGCVCVRVYALHTCVCECVIDCMHYTCVRTCEGCMSLGAVLNDSPCQWAPSLWSRYRMARPCIN
jgi:hypothetical protein